MSVPRPARYTFEARPSDLIGRLSGNLYEAGCCCCCCCLHWIATVAGGAIGIRSAWKASQRSGPIHSAHRRAVLWGLVLGLLLTGTISMVTGWWFYLAFVPSLVFLPCLGTMALWVTWEGARLRRAYRTARQQLAAGAEPPPPQGVFRTTAMTTRPTALAPGLMGVATYCSACRYRLGEAVVVLECPQCGTPFDLPAMPVVAQGYRFAMAVGMRAFLWSTGLSIVAYGLMYLIFLGTT